MLTGKTDRNQHKWLTPVVPTFNIDLCN